MTFQYFRHIEYKQFIIKVLEIVRSSTSTFGSSTVQVLMNLKNQIFSSTGKMCTWQVQVLEYLNHPESCGACYPLPTQNKYILKKLQRSDVGPLNKTVDPIEMPSLLS